MDKTDFQFDKENHVYTLNGKRMYGITSVLGVIAKNALIQWSANEAVKYIKENSSGYEMFGGEQTKFLSGITDELLDKARFAHKKKKEDAADKGHDTHSLIETLVLGAIQSNGGYLKGASDNQQVQHFIDWAVTHKIKFLESEKQMYCDQNGLFIAGTVDLVFQKDDKTYIGDIKTYAKLWDRTPMLQCAAYGLMYRNMFEKKIDGYCILLLTKTGEFKEQWSYDVEGDTKGFLAAYQLFKTLENWS